MVPSPKITAINISFFMVTASMAVRLAVRCLALEALWFSQGHDPANRIRLKLNSSQDDQDHNDQQDSSKAAAREVSPITAVVPSGKRSKEHENQDDDQDGSKHVVSPFC
jgi:hypothetical protein